MVPSVIGLIGSSRLTITGQDRANQAGVIGASTKGQAEIVAALGVSRMSV